MVPGGSSQSINCGSVVKKDFPSHSDLLFVITYTYVVPGAFTVGECKCVVAAGQRVGGRLGVPPSAPLSHRLHPLPYHSRSSQHVVVLEGISLKQECTYQPSFFRQFVFNQQDTEVMAMQARGVAAAAELCYVQGLGK